METEKTNKLNIGVKANPELKMKLIEESKETGITLSEYCENILSVHKSLIEEINYLKSTIDEMEETISEMENLISSLDNNHLYEKIDNLYEKKYALKKEIKILKSNQEIFSDPQLNELFEKVKNKKDSIKTKNGEMHITYSSKIDVLRALIYSHNI
jgi:hypothetical protein